MIGTFVIKYTPYLKKLIIYGSGWYSWLKDEAVFITASRIEGDRLAGIRVDSHA